MTWQHRVPIIHHSHARVIIVSLNHSSNYLTDVILHGKQIQKNHASFSLRLRTLSTATLHCLFNLLCESRAVVALETVASAPYSQTGTTKSWIRSASAPTLHPGQQLCAATLNITSMNAVEIPHWLALTRRHCRHRKIGWAYFSLQKRGPQKWLHDFSPDFC